MQVYARTIRRTMIACLSTLYARCGLEGALTVSEIEPEHNKSADFEKLRHWGLIRPVERHRWIVTRAGEEFLSGALGVRKYVYLYDGRVQAEPINRPNPIVFVHEIVPESVSKERALTASTPQRAFRELAQPQLF